MTLFDEINDWLLEAGHSNTNEKCALCNSFWVGMLENADKIWFLPQ